MTLLPAYGRDYKSKQAVLDAWNSGKDFRIASIEKGGTYINKQDAQRLVNPPKIYIRYNRKQKITEVPIHATPTRSVTSR